MSEPIERAFLAQDSRVVAPQLLGCVLSVGDRSGRVVEVEAYAGGEDAGSHGYRGVTPRTATMFGPAGHLYVYFTYGMHWCANIVCGATGTCSAVLIRALAPLTGLEAMRQARGSVARRDRDLCSGPAKLCQALGIDGDMDGTDICEGPLVTLAREADEPEFEVATTTRVGLTKGAEHPWRWYIVGDPNVSPGRPSVPVS